MTTLTVDIPDSARERIEKYILRVGGKVVTKTKARTKLPIEELEEAFAEIKGMENGTLPKRSLEEAFSGS